MRRALSLALLLGAASAAAQSEDMSGMPGMEMQSMPQMNMAPAGVLGSYAAARDASGTSWQPDAAQLMGGFHLLSGNWMFMGHFMLFGIYDTQSGPRGGDKLFAAGMLMGMVRRDFSAADTLQFRAMLSPDAFMGKSGYPLLLASGETANGAAPLIDRQHPHDLFMELSGTYRHQLSDADSVFLYAGYPGEPALGPTAFPHRASDMDFPVAPITHHWLDSTHIVFGVLTAGFVHNDWKLEVSQFTGREPDENRFDFDSLRLDSTSMRASWNPDAHWSLQASWGHLKSPEQLEPEIDENRITASATYIAQLGDESSIAATFGWGLKRLSNGADLNGLLAETEYKPADLWTVFARGEWEENNELDAFGRVRRVGEFTLGALRDFRLARHLKLGLGALYTFDFVPPSIAPPYGGSPHGFMSFARLASE